MFGDLCPPYSSTQSRAVPGQHYGVLIFEKESIINMVHRRCMDERAIRFIPIYPYSGRAAYNHQQMGTLVTLRVADGSF